MPSIHYIPNIMYACCICCGSFVTCVVVEIVTNLESQHVMLRNIASTHDKCANAPVGSAESTRR